MLFVTSCLFLLSCVKQKIEKKSSELPNIIFILADDLGYADLSCYGSNYVETPVLDNLAKNGIKFTNFYAASAVCTPTRASVLTGNYPLRYGITKHFGNKEHYLTNKAITIPKVLNTKGYYSAQIGKWHLGGLDTLDINRRRKGEKARPGPLEHGFDYYLGALRYGLKNERRLFKDAGKYLVENETYLEADSNHWTDINVNKTLEIIEDCHNNNTPFFINLWFDAPHTPYEPAPEPYYRHFKGKIPDPVNGHYNKANQKGDGDFYYSMIAHMDDGIGQILTKLKELNIEENTLVVFTSDNGPSYRGEPGMNKAGKADLHEGGIKVPMIAYMKGVIQSGIVSEELLNTIDLLPTFSDFAGVKIKEQVDGISFKNHLLHNNSVDREEMFWQMKTYNWYPQPGEKPKPYTDLVYRKNEWKMLGDTIEPKLLYNLKKDPKEEQNLMDNYPELTQELYQKALKIWNEERIALQRHPYE